MASACWVQVMISKQKKIVENPGIDPGTSRMLSGRSTIWANSPTTMNVSYKTNVLKKGIARALNSRHWLSSLLLCLFVFFLFSVYFKVCHHHFVELCTRASLKSLFLIPTMGDGTCSSLWIYVTSKRPPDLFLVVFPKIVLWCNRR